MAIIFVINKPVHVTLPSYQFHQLSFTQMVIYEKKKMPKNSQPYHLIITSASDSRWHRRTGPLVCGGADLTCPKKLFKTIAQKIQYKTLQKIITVTRYKNQDTNIYFTSDLQRGTLAVSYLVREKKQREENITITDI